MSKEGRVSFRAAVEHIELFKRAAAAEGMSLSTWLVTVALRAARSVLRKEKR